MSESLYDHGLWYTVFQHRGCQVVPEDVCPLPVSWILPHSCNPTDFCYDVCNSLGRQWRKGMCFCQEQAGAAGIRPFRFQVIIYGIPHNSRKRKFSGYGCFLLCDQSPFSFPVNGMESKPGDVTTPKPRKKEQEENRPITCRNFAFFCCFP